MKILITGGAGFIGSHLADALIKENHEVTIWDNLSAGKKENINPAAKFKKVDVGNFKKVKKLFSIEKFEAVYHFAAQINSRKSVLNPVEDAMDILSALNLIECANSWNINNQKKGFKKFIFASTGVVYGEEAKRPIKEIEKEWPACPYGIEKLTVDKYLSYYKKVFDLNYVSFRFSNVFGPRQNPKSEAGVISIFLEKMFKGEQPIIYGDGEQTRDYIYVKDVVDANLLALSDIKQTGVYNLGTGKETSVNELFKEINGFFSNKFEIIHGPAQLGEERNISLDSKKFQQDFNWSAKTNLKEGLETTRKWFLKNNNK